MAHPGTSTLVTERRRSAGSGHPLRKCAVPCLHNARYPLLSLARGCHKENTSRGNKFCRYNLYYLSSILIVKFYMLKYNFYDIFIDFNIRTINKICLLFKKLF